MRVIEHVHLKKKGYEKSPLSIFGLVIKILVGVVILYAAFLLFRYAIGKGDWDLIAGPIKSLFGKK